MYLFFSLPKFELIDPKRAPGELKSISFHFYFSGGKNLSREKKKGKILRLKLTYQAGLRMPRLGGRLPSFSSPPFFLFFYA
jgi:hypothetical protein